jgi:recombination protein RecA
MKTNTPATTIDKVDKAKALDLAISAIHKQFGGGSLLKLGSVEALKVDVLSTGSLAIDIALGVGGLPKGRIAEIYGPEASGKTTFCLAIIAEAQRKGGKAAFIDVEHALDPHWARTCGVNTNELLISQPDCGEDALNITEALIKSGAIDLVVVDSVAALVTKAELDGQMGDATVGAQARLMSQAMRRLAGAINRARCVCLFTNQIREKIGVMFGSPETTPGGRALKFFSSVRIDIRKRDQIKGPDGTVNGNRCKVKIVKNKVASPYTECEFDILCNEGISNVGSLLDYGLEAKLLEKKGSYFVLNGELIGQGREAASQFLRDHPEIAQRIEKEVKEKLLKAKVIEDNQPLLNLGGPVGETAGAGELEGPGAASDAAAA